ANKSCSRCLEEARPADRAVHRPAAAKRLLAGPRPQRFAADDRLTLVRPERTPVRTDLDRPPATRSLELGPPAPEALSDATRMDSGRPHRRLQGSTRLPPAWRSLRPGRPVARECLVAGLQRCLKPSVRSLGFEECCVHRLTVRATE